ncbi:MAG: glycosyltransferase family 4 protein [Phycisphaerales bacterium]|nr:glycosyltransferase family 4 protein [Phycisphaerales bacterium]
MTTDGTPRESPEPTGRGRTLAFVVNTLTPYRIQSQLRFKHELPGWDVKTYIHWDVSKNLWVFKNPPDIGLVTFDGAVDVSSFGTWAHFSGDWRTGGKIIQRLEQDRPAAVIACGYGYPAPLRVLLWCKRNRIPVFLWGDSNIHADNPSGLKGLVKQLGVPRVVKLFNAYLVCGGNGRAYYLRYGAAPDRIFPCPVEPDYSLIESATDQEMAAARTSLGLTEGRRRIVVCSRLVPVKAVDQAIDAFAAVAARRPEWEMVILGDGPLRASLEARVPSSCLDRVIFAGFQDDQRVVNAVYRQSDVLLHPATWEPWGVVILEAAAAGLAIITTRVVGAALELAQDGVNGRLVRPLDRRGLTRALLDTTDPANIDRYKAGSRRLSADFRREQDPVRGLAGALACVGLATRAEPG